LCACKPGKFALGEGLQKKANISMLINIFGRQSLCCDCKQLLGKAQQYFLLCGCVFTCRVVSQASRAPKKTAERFFFCVYDSQDPVLQKRHKIREHSLIKQLSSNNLQKK